MLSSSAYDEPLIKNLNHSNNNIYYLVSEKNKELIKISKDPSQYMSSELQILPLTSFGQYQKYYDNIKIHKADLAEPFKQIIKKIEEFNRNSGITLESKSMMQTSHAHAVHKQSAPGYIIYKDIVKTSTNTLGIKLLQNFPQQGEDFNFIYGLYCEVDTNGENEFKVMVPTGSQNNHIIIKSINGKPVEQFVNLFSYNKDIPKKVIKKLEKPGTYRIGYLDPTVIPITENKINRVWCYERNKTEYQRQDLRES